MIDIKGHDFFKTDVSNLCFPTHASGGAWSAAEYNPLDAVVSFKIDLALRSLILENLDHKATFL